LLAVAVVAVTLVLEIMAGRVLVVSALVQVWQLFLVRRTQLQLVLVVRLVQMAQIPQ
jgi:hypothetical protein